MANKRGTLLTGVKDFPASAAQQLAGAWITTAEEFASAAGQTGGIVSLAQQLGVDSNAVNTLLTAVRAVLPEGVAFDDENVEVALGALPVEGSAERGVEPAAMAQLPPQVDLHSKMPPVRNQGGRGTCVAHATAAVREYLLGDQSTSGNLSEQFIYWACKQRDGYPGGGTYIRIAMGVLHDLGVCPETVWPYNGEQLANNEGQGPPPANALTEATANRIVHFTPLNATSVDSLRGALAAGSPIAFSVSVFESCQRPYVFRNADLHMPLPGERKLGGHAMCMVGYVDDPDVPGGGYFIVRNSWGEAFGYDGEVAGGYCRIPYAYLQRYGMEAYAASLT